MSIFANTLDDSCTSLESSPSDWDGVSFNRIESSYENRSERFTYKQSVFDAQYFNMYNTRMDTMLECLKNGCVKKWGNDIVINRLSEVPILGFKKYYLVGMLNKNQVLKPSIINELSADYKLNPPPRKANFVAQTDQLTLEDRALKVILTGNIDINKFVCGIIIGVYGWQTKIGIFHVEEYSLIELNVNIDRNISPPDEVSYVLMVSGLDIAGTTDILSIQLMIDWVNGELGCPADQKIQSRICRVIIAGNSARKKHRKENIYLTPAEVAVINRETVENVKLLDKLLSNLVRTVPVDILPGGCDPSNHTFPQQPMHKLIFKKAGRFKSFNRVTNPYECSVNGRIILGTSGEPINDIMSLTDYSHPLDALESTLLWGHMAPTAPDSLACYPIVGSDPFIIKDPPDIYFTGNAAKFGAKTVDVKGRPVCLVCVPMFAKTQTCALVNLKTLECAPLRFKTFGQEF